MDAALKKGDLKFTLDGYKLKGSWVLVRTGGRYGSRGGDARSWLLIKHRDDWAGDVDITEFAPRSVKSDGDFEDILAADNPDVWVSHRPAEGGEAGAMLAKIIERAAALKAGRKAPETRKKDRRAESARTRESRRSGHVPRGRPRLRRPSPHGKRPRPPHTTKGIRESTRMKKADVILFSGGAPGAEAEFGECAERHGIEEVNFTFDGHTIARHRGVRVLNHEELQAGDVSLGYVSRLMHRRYTDSPLIRKRAADAVVPGEQRPGDLRGRRDPGRRHRARRHRLGGGVREAVQQAVVRLRPGEGRLVRVERRGLAAADARRRSSRTRTSPAPARATSRTTPGGRSKT